MPLSSSPKLNLALANMGMLTPRDVIEHLPYRYESYFLTEKKSHYEDKERVVKKGKIAQKGKSLRFSKRSLTSFYFSTDEETFLVEAWNRPYLSSYLKIGEECMLIGMYEKKRNCLSLVNIVKGEIPIDKALKPIYSLPKDIPNHVFSSLAKRCLAKVTSLPDELPPSLKEKYRLCSHLEALRIAHEPKSKEELYQSSRRLKYEEALHFALSSALIRESNKAIRKEKKKPIDMNKVRSFLSSLPYRLSSSQRTALREIALDMDKETVMYRLLQGDVGTGKTLVAALSAFMNYTRGEQTAILAPTDALARQHYDNLKKLFALADIKITLLVGALSAEERKVALSSIESGESDIIIGTHALFSERVDYASLGLVIIDEQHKFGVNQRARLLNKGEDADLLLMSATPIPRTLALTIYGDLDISTLDEFPQGKRKVKTTCVKEKDPSIDALIEESISTGHRVYIIVPQIEGENDSNTSVIEVCKRYKAKFPAKVTLMHGKMNDEAKEEALNSFKSGLTPILVATSLVEVGIDVKEADLMIVYSPTHFSLSSLHQLRGRIGRGGDEANFILLLDKKNQEDNEKLKILEKEDDGFKIAEEDMRLRGPGEMAGVKQSGLPSFQVASIIDDFKMFECARDDAKYLLLNKSDPVNAKYIEKVNKEIGEVSLA